jgi:hypothetical protein
MIGVVANEAEHAAVAEFFELFKTPWEFCRPGSQYDVLLCSNTPAPENDTKLLLLYGSQKQPFEKDRSIKTSCAPGHNFALFRGERIPIYGNCLLLEGLGNEVLVHKGTKSLTPDAQVVVRLGFDLFDEVHNLLTKGQPAELAGIPTLELHISLLRDLIISHGVTLVEIPPVPAGHRFIVSLTHDVDHPRVRQHICDHTMFGFLYRALIGSVINLCRGRRSLRQVVTNWKAVFSLPLVFAGILKDFWNQLDWYLDLEKDLASTFFVIPTKGDAGVDSSGKIRAKRASRYALSDIADDLTKLLSANREIAVHGIDSWRDGAKGRDECKQVQKITGTAEIGVRMHWLYFDSHSPATLENAGYSYDSTVGYNETIGYRAGTTQVFKHAEVDHLLELPMHIMDTALFYPSYMDLSDEKAGNAMLTLIENATRLGGVLTINWHDRSLGPERLWGDVYVTLLENLRAKKPWFATAAQTVSWFRNRRETSFDRVTRDGQKIRVQPANNRGAGNAANIPPLTVRVYNRAGSTGDLHRRRGAFEDFTIETCDSLLIAA